MLSDTRLGNTQNGAILVMPSMCIIGEDIRKTDNWRNELSIMQRMKSKSLLKPGKMLLVKALMFGRASSKLLAGSTGTEHPGLSSWRDVHPACMPSAAMI